MNAVKRFLYASLMVGLMLVMPAAFGGQYVTSGFHWTGGSGQAPSPSTDDAIAHASFGSGSVSAQTEACNTVGQNPNDTPTVFSMASASADCSGEITRYWVPDPNKENDPAPQSSVSMSGSGSTSWAANCAVQAIAGTHAYAHGDAAEVLLRDGVVWVDVTATLPDAARERDPQPGSSAGRGSGASALGFDGE